MKFFAFGLLSALFATQAFCQDEIEQNDATVAPTEEEIEAQADMEAAQQEWAFRHTKEYQESKVINGHFVVPFGASRKKGLKHDEALKEQVNRAHQSEINKVENAHHFVEYKQGAKHPHKNIRHP